MYLKMLRDHENLTIQNGSMKAIKDAYAVLREACSNYHTTKAVVNQSQEMIALRVTHREDWRAAQPQHSAFLGVCYQMALPRSSGI